MISDLRIYLAASLFSPFERQRNSQVAQRLAEHGFTVFLPQDIRTSTGDRPPADIIFRQCVDGIDDADLVIGLVDGADVDSGTAWELGYAYARGKLRLLLRTDYRSAEHGPVNIMLEFSSRLVIANKSRSAAVDAIDTLLQSVIQLVQDRALKTRPPQPPLPGASNDWR
ncbi:MAG: nucleoside 2-deoxyribosyltransferase [Candidatus Rokuibacteriota bacterium]